MKAFEVLNKKILFFSFLTAFLIASVAPQLISGFQLLRRTGEEQKSSLNENNYLIARQISKELDEFQIERWISTLNGLNATLGSGARPDAGQNIEIVNSYFRQFGELVILSFRKDPESAPKHYINQNFLGEINRLAADSLSKLFTFQTDLFPPGGNVLICDAVSLQPPQGYYLPIEVRRAADSGRSGILRGVFQLAPVFRFIDQDMSSVERQIYIMDENGRILFQNRYGLFGDSASFPSRIGSPFAQNAPVFQTLNFQYRGSPYLGYLYPTQRTGWKVVVVYAYEKAYAFVSRIRHQIMIDIGVALFLSLGLSFLFAWFHSSVIVHAKEALQNYATKLEQGNAELEAFASSISHDLSAPLRHIMGYADILEMRLSSTLDSKSLHQIHNISDAARNLQALIHHVLVFSRLGYADINRVRIDTTQMVRLTCEKLRSETDSRSVTWKIGRCEPVWGDPAMIQQVLYNLLSNAVKFTSMRDEPVIEVGTVSEADEVIVYVSDNGIGFDMKERNKLFGLFQRLHADAGFEGSGVGLAHVRRIIAKHGGRTWAEGMPGGGAIFYFSLPHEKRQEKADHSKKGTTVDRDIP
ncbi:hypothetical protein JW906_06365 [bacterium]|nr:hypothetical protein [bacterium]